MRPLIPGPAKLGRPPRYGKRAILHAIFCVVRSGCSWRMLPGETPPWRIVRHCFMRWREDGVWVELHEAPRDAPRQRSGKKSPPGLRHSTRKALGLPTAEAGAALRRERRSLAANDAWWSTPLGSPLGCS